ncbi:BQ2448_7084 [Microbotryum intermedium]|uniref:BQ2448_7084 protein n=1 Tax=Microbotryum intermedium TaxID=269621 RepID=A0A238FK35_9BASI|nr:BQ2448_7084 [Microbotryum intermedium]
MTTNAFLTSPSRGPSRVVRATQSCELCIVDRHNPLCEYGIDNIRQSRHFMGSGHRVRRFMEKALRGENVTIGVMGASDTAGHGLKNGLSWHERMTEQLQAHFPNLKVHVGAEAGMNSKLFAYCFDSVVPRDLDMYMVELDINNDAVSGTFVADDHLYRGLLGLPQEPAVIRVSVFALGFTELLRGFGSNIGTSAFFDIPVIGIRNWILPHIIKNPDQAELFFSKDWAGTTDLRHIGEESHRALGDMIALYLEEQKCEAERRQYSADKVADPVLPTCQFVASETAPLVAFGNEWSEKWRKEEWNGKRAWTSSEVGAIISFEFIGARVGIFVWATNGAGNTVKPGQARCWVDDTVERGVIVDAYKSGKAAGSSWNTVADPIDFGEHMLTCEILSSSSTGGHDFRILGVANN